MFLTVQDCERIPDDYNFKLLHNRERWVGPKSQKKIKIRFAEKAVLFIWNCGFAKRPSGHFCWMCPSRFLWAYVSLCGICIRLLIAPIRVWWSAHGIFPKSRYVRNEVSRPRFPRKRLKDWVKDFDGNPWLKRESLTRADPTEEFS